MKVIVTTLFLSIIFINNSHTQQNSPKQLLDALFTHYKNEEFDEFTLLLLNKEKQEIKKYSEIEEPLTKAKKAFDKMHKELGEFYTYEIAKTIEISESCKRIFCLLKHKDSLMLLDALFYKSDKWQIQKFDFFEEDEIEEILIKYINE